MLSSLILAALVGCAPQPASITFDGEPMVTVNTLDAIPLKSAKVLDKAGKAIATPPKITWTVTPDTTAKLEGEKSVKPLANGEATVTATIGQVKGTYTVVVAVPDKIEIVGYDAAKPIGMGGNQVLKANVLAGTKPVENQKVMWKTSDDKIVTVANGKVTGVAIGKATISANLGTLEAKVEVEVVAADPNAPLKAGIEVMKELKKDGKEGKKEEKKDEGKKTTTKKK